MSIDRAVLAFAGFVVLLSLALGWYVSPLWFLLTAFAGVNMIQAAISTCRDAAAATEDTSQSSVTTLKPKLFSPVPPSAMVAARAAAAAAEGRPDTRSVPMAGSGRRDGPG